MRMVVLAAALVTAMATAAPAAADDAYFVDVLDLMDITVGDAPTAVAMGRSVCADFDLGTPLAAVVDRLAGTHGLSAEDAALVAGFSVAEYCDQHEPALRPAS
ncbi:DUF732 domain-containing protein [Mycobacterium sp. C31M]